MTATDQLAAIEARIRDCQTYNFGMRNADKLAHEDAPALLATIREQAGKLEAVRVVERNLEGAAHWADRRIAADIRDALGAGDE